MTQSDPNTSFNQIQKELKEMILETFGNDDSNISLPNDIPILELGISSLALVEGMRRVYDRFGVLISIRRIIEGQVTLGGLALYIDKEIHKEHTQKNKGGAPRGKWIVEREIPLAASQQHSAFLSRYSGEAGAAFNESVLVKLSGVLDGPALQAAVEEAGNRYEALRTALHSDSNSLQIGSGEALDVQVEAVPKGKLGQWMKAAVGVPFEPGKRLFRAELLRINEDEHILALTGHLLVIDQESLGIVLEDIARLYSAFTRDKPATLMAPCLQWTDYVSLGDTLEARQSLKDAYKFWEESSSGLPQLELPASHPRPPVKKYSSARFSTRLDAPAAELIRDWAVSNKTTPSTIILAAFNIFLHRLTTASEIVTGVQSEPLYLDTGIPSVAVTRNMLPLRSSFEPGRSFSDTIHEMGRLQDLANKHRLLSLAEMIPLLKLQRDQSRSPIFTVAFRTINRPAAPQFEGLHTSHMLPPSPGARYDLELISIEDQEGINLVFDYSTELFEQETISRWANCLKALLRSALDNPSTTCGLLPVMPGDELEIVLREWNKTETAVDQSQTILDLIIKQAHTRNGQTAVRYGNTSINYDQLLEQTEGIAVLLFNNGVKKGDRVGIFLKRSTGLIPAILAVWRLAAMYVPIDTAFPGKRIAFMLSDASVQTVITSRDLLPMLEKESGSCKIIYLEDVRDHNTILPDGIQPAENEDSAYIMFTSGSTGKPKGVEVRHRALLNFLMALQEYIQITPRSKMLALTTISFDISTAELFPPLILGGEVEVAEDGLAADGIQLAERITTTRPTHVQATPSSWKSLLETGWLGWENLCLMSAGEALNRELSEQLLKNDTRLLNLYGPTETTVYSTACQVTSEPGKAVRIGRPLFNTRLYVLDSRMQPMPIGAAGDLYIGGEGVSPGYWNMPELTAERFLPDPFHPGERIYRTGDLAYFMPDGSLICLGRADEQVKIHGVRVELGEIETALLGLAEVRDAVVTPWRDLHGDLQLVAHIIPSQSEAPDAGNLREQLREKLPEVMVPPYFLFTGSFPHTANGKIHRAALPTPTTANQNQRPQNVLPPATQTEKALAEAWADVIGIDVHMIGRDSDFMDLGGHSLLMTRMMLEVRKIFQTVFNMREFFDALTIRKFAALVDERRAKASSVIQTGQPAQTERDAEWARQRMAFLSREAQLPHYLAPARGLSFKPAEQIETVFLTGATGFLGAYIVKEILKNTQANLYCLVRPKRGENSKQRIERQMRNFDIWPGDEAWQSTWDARIQVVDGDITLPRLGMSDHRYETLARQVDAIFHGAAHVNFIYPYEALRATNVLGVHEIIQFAFHARIKPVHHLSTAAIWPMGAKYTFYEKDPIDHNGLLNLGYDEAKWVGEKCLRNAAERGLPVARYRPGEVGGDSITGHCVTDHFLIACIKGFLQFGAFPELDIEVDVAPVDYVAKSMVYLAFHRKPFGRAFHLTNPSRRHMKDALAFLRNLGYQFDVLPFSDLRNRLVSSPNFASNALFAYQAALEDMDQVSMQLPNYDTRETRRELEGSGIVCAPADEKLFETYLHYLRGIGFMPEPENFASGVGGHA